MPHTRALQHLVSTVGWVLRFYRQIGRAAKERAEDAGDLCWTSIHQDADDITARATASTERVRNCSGHRYELSIAQLSFRRDHGGVIRCLEGAFDHPLVQKRCGHRRADSI